MASISFPDRLIKLALKISGARDSGRVKTTPICDKAINYVFRHTSSGKISNLTSSDIVVDFESDGAVTKLINELVEGVRVILITLNIVLKAAAIPAVAPRPKRAPAEVIRQNYTLPPPLWESLTPGQTSSEDPFNSRPISYPKTDSIYRRSPQRPTVSPLTEPNIENSGIFGEYTIPGAFD